MPELFQTLNKWYQSTKEVINDMLTEEGFTQISSKTNDETAQPEVSNPTAVELQVPEPGQLKPVNPKHIPVKVPETVPETIKLEPLRFEPPPSTEPLGIETSTSTQPFSIETPTPVISDEFKADMYRWFIQWTSTGFEASTTLARWSWTKAGSTYTKLKNFVSSSVSSKALPSNVKTYKRPQHPLTAYTKMVEELDWSQCETIDPDSNSFTLDQLTKCKEEIKKYLLNELYPSVDLYHQNLIECKDQILTYQSDVIGRTDEMLHKYADEWKQFDLDRTKCLSDLRSERKFFYDELNHAQQQIFNVYGEFIECRNNASDWSIEFKKCNESLYEFTRPKTLLELKQKQAAIQVLIDELNQGVKGMGISTNEIIIRYIQQTFLIIFCWPLYLSQPDCIVWQIAGKGRVPNAWVRQIIASGLTSVWFLIIAQIFSFVVLQTLKWTGQKIAQKRDEKRDEKEKTDNIMSKIRDIKEALINNQIRGGSILAYSEPLVFEFLHPAFICIHILRMTKLLKLKIGEEIFEKTVNNPNTKVVKPARRPRVRPFFVCLLLAMRSRMSVNYVNIGQDSRQQICLIAPIERLSCTDFETSYAIKNESVIQIQPGNNSFGFQPNKKLMTLGEFEVRRGVDKEGNVPISKRRNLSRIHKLKRNRVGTFKKLREESQSLETISSDNGKPTEVSFKIPVSNKQL